jgi:hypothetical protein
LDALNPIVVFVFALALHGVLPVVKVNTETPQARAVAQGGRVLKELCGSGVNPIEKAAAKPAGQRKAARPLPVMSGEQICQALTHHFLFLTRRAIRRERQLLPPREVSVVWDMNAVAGRLLAALGLIAQPAHRAGQSIQAVLKTYELGAIRLAMLFKPVGADEAEMVIARG